MPTPKRWCPISRDLNDDPEVWELTVKFSDRSLRIFFEVIAIIDRTENRWRLSGHWLASLSRKVRQKPATVRLVIDWMVAKGWLVIEERSADGSPSVYSARNYWKYHKRREPNGATSGTDAEPTGSQIRTPSFPIRPLNNLKEERGRVETVDRGDREQDCFYGVGNTKAGAPNGHGRGTPNGFSSVGSVMSQIIQHAELASK